MNWRHGVLLAIVGGTLAIVFAVQPVAQDLAYHRFVDARACFGMNNCLNVLSNLPFVWVGAIGLWAYAAGRLRDPSTAWLAYFVGVSFVAFGSGYYHVNPSNESLIWDRLPMTIGFMGLFAAILGETVHAALGRYLLWPAIAVGIISIVIWARYDDLRLYGWVQFMPLLIVAVVLALFPSPYTHRKYLLHALVWYVLAKLAEFWDGAIFDITGGAVSGHSLKHLCAAVACYFLYLMLRKRERVMSLRMPEATRTA